MARKQYPRGPYCAASWCNNFHGCRVDKPYSFYSFPKDPERFAQWVKFTLRHDLIGKTPVEGKSWKLCSAHFQDSQIRKLGGRTTLIRSAIPTIVEEKFCPGTVPSVSESSELSSEDTVLGVDMVIPSNLSSSAGTVSSESSVLDSEDTVFGMIVQRNPSSSHDGCESIAQDSVGNISTITWDKVNSIQDADMLLPSSKSALHNGNPGEMLLVDDSLGNVPLTSACVATSAWDVNAIQDVDTPGPSHFPTYKNIEDGLELSQTPIQRTPEKRMGESSSHSQPTPRTSARINRFKRKLSMARSKLFRTNNLDQHKNKALTRRKELNNIVKSASKFMTKGTYNIFKLQLKFSQVSKFGRRYPSIYKNFALNLYYHSPRTYRFLRKTLYLPSVSSLLNWQKCVTIKPGVDINTLSAMKEKGMKSSERQCVALVMDEISIKEHLQYDCKSDTILGFCSDGLEQTPLIGTHCLVFMVKGLSEKWKQTLGYWVRNEKNKSAVIDLLRAVEECIDSLQKINFSVKVLICDQSPHNQALCVKLGVTVDTPYFLRGEEKVFFMFDTPHLLKSLRNNLANYDFDYDGKIVKWSHFKALFESTDPLKLRMTPKITKLHVEVRAFKKMKVKLAAQAFSDSVSIAMCTLVKTQGLPSEALATADFFGDVDKAFDTFNSVRCKEHAFKFNYAISEGAQNHTFLGIFYEKLKKSKFINCRRQPACLRGWMLNIQSLFALCKDLRENFNISAICTRNINQDCLENLFSTIRQQNGCSTNPTLTQFSKGIKHHILSTLPKLSSSSNCEMDVEYVFSKVAEFLEDHPEYEPQYEENDEFPVFDYSDLDINDDVEEGTLYYVAGYLCMHYLKSHACEICRGVLTVGESSRVLEDDHQFFTYLKGNESLQRDFGGLTLPKREVFEVIKKWEARFQRVFSSVKHMQKVCSKIKLIFEEDPDLEMVDLCSQTSTAMFLEHFIRIRVLWAVKFLNRQRIEVKLTKVRSNPRSMLHMMHI